MPRPLASRARALVPAVLAVAVLLPGSATPVAGTAPDHGSDSTAARGPDRSSRQAPQPAPHGAPDPTPVLAPDPTPVLAPDAVTAPVEVPAAEPDSTADAAPRPGAAASPGAVERPTTPVPVAAPPAAPPPDAPAPGAVAAAMRVLTPADFGAVGDGATDDSAALQRALDALGPGDSLVLPAGATFAHADVLRVRGDGVTVTGGGALHATRPESSTLWVEGDDATVSGITLTCAASERGGTWEDTGLLLFGTSGATVEGVTVRGSRSAGIFVDSSTGFTVRDVLVEDTRADGVHVTRGSSRGTVERATVRRSGDDGIAVVSYARDEPVHDVTITSPVVETTTGGRGLSVVGGRDVHLRDIRVEASDAAALFIASEAGWDTHPTRGVTVQGGTLVGANTSDTVDHGAILVLADGGTHTVDDVTVSDVVVRDTHPRASRETGVLGAATGVELRRISVVGGGGRGLFVSDDPAARFTLTGWSKDGRAVPDQSQ